MRHRPSLAVLLTLLCVTGFTGCECATRNPVAPPDPTRRVVRLELSPATDTLVVGDTRTFVAVAHDSTDAVIVGAPVAWSSDDPAVVSVGAGGAAVAVGEGVTRVIARSGTAADTAIVAVIVRTGWYLQTSGTTADLAGVAFRRDGRVGVAVGAGGTIVRTTDAGASWAARTSGTTSDLRDVWFASDAIVYEVHAKGFTANSASGVLHPGTLRGFAEKADYLAGLGVTAVELLPPFEKPLDGGYWGYNTLGFFALEHSYLSRNDQAFGLDEWKAMVEALHARGIEVIVDVVYNHTGEGGLWRQKVYQTNVAQPWNLDPAETASNYGFRGLDNASYYRLVKDQPRYSINDTGTGNTLNLSKARVIQAEMKAEAVKAGMIDLDGLKLADLSGVALDEAATRDSAAMIAAELVLFVMEPS